MRLKHSILALIAGLSLGLLICSSPAEAAQVQRIHASGIESFAMSAARLGGRGQAVYGSRSDMYVSRRLIVKGNGLPLDLAKYNPNTLVEGYGDYYVLSFDTAEETQKALSAIKRQENVAYVEADKPVKSSDTQFRGEYRIASSGTSSLSWGTPVIGADVFAAKVAGSTRSTMKVAVVDSGVYKNHAFLKGKILSGGIDLIDGDKDPNDLHGHGTHCSGTIVDVTAGTNVKILPVRVLDSSGMGSSIDFASGILYAAEQGAKVISMSVNLEYGNHDEYLHEACQYATDKGAVVVCSAGNNAGDVAHCCPSDQKEIIIVGAVDQDLELAYFSNYGATLDFAAPGVDINSSLCDGGYAEWSGTSMATPHISGLAALLRLAHPSYGVKEVNTALRKYCKDLGAPGRDDAYGYGMPYMADVSVIPAASISLDKTSAAMKANETLKLNAALTPSNATINTITWTSSNTSIAVVKSGVVQAKKEGTVTITAKTANNKKAVCTITVKKAPTMPRTAFSLASYNASTKKAAVRHKLYFDADETQIQLQNEKKKTLKTKTGTSSLIFTDIKPDKVYYYRARAVYHAIDGSTLYGAWSYRRAFTTAVPKAVKTKNHAGIVIKAPSTSGVRKFEVYMSTSKTTSSYSKVGTVSAGGKVYISKLKGKLLKKYSKKTKFYVKLKPVLSNDPTIDKLSPVTSFTLY